MSRPAPSAPRTATITSRTRLHAALAVAATLTLLAPLAPHGTALAQTEGTIKVGGSGSANFELAARFAPYKISDLVHSLRVTPRWIEETDRFWYEWESSEGRHFYLVDPAQGSRTEIFDNDRIAAELTRITRDPWDAQHLPIRAIRFTGPNTIQFDVESSQDEEVEEEEEEDIEEEDQEDEQQRGPSRPQTRKRVHHFEYDVTTRTLRELEDYEEPDSHPGWASVSPDTAWVVFSREFNLWMMSYEEYMKIVEARRGKTGDDAEEAEEDVEVEEVQLTTDGEQDFSWGSQGRGQNDEETEEEFKKRQSSGTTWSHDSRYFALTRQDRREVGKLWVVHAVGNTRPKLESYRYDMPGEENVTQASLHVFDMESREMTQVDDDAWKDQRMGIFNAPRAGGGGFFFFGGGGWCGPRRAQHHEMAVGQQQRALLLAPEPRPASGRRDQGGPVNRRGHRRDRGAFEHVRGAPDTPPPGQRGPHLVVGTGRVGAPLPLRAGRNGAHSSYRRPLARRRIDGSE